MWFPTVDQVIEFHAELIADTGGEAGILHPGDIEAAVHRAKDPAYDEEASLFLRAAYLVRGIAQDHPFVDGNKRTAFETMDVFLRRNGWEIDASTDQVVDFTIEVATGMQLDEIRAWIEDHSRNL